jgi:hypothetical protein
MNLSVVKKVIKNQQILEIEEKYGMMLTPLQIEIKPN